jgi:large subunit ribosomal protein L2
MGIRIYKPTSAGRRNSSVDTFSDITKTTPEKSLTWYIKKNAGRNSRGKITVYHRGGGVKRKYRMIDFLQDRFDLPATVQAIEYDPNRSARIALVTYADGKKAYILAPDGLKVGDTVTSSKKKIEVKPGNRMPIKYIHAGMPLMNIELNPGKGGGIVRSAGIAATIMGAEGDYILVKLPSTEVRKFHKDCLATVGQVSNIDHRNVRWGKAGRMRYKGIRPTVRGKVKNPVDHPHGGGEGNQPIGLKHPKTPWGKPALGVKTRSKTKKSNAFIVSRRKKN